MTHRFYIYPLVFLVVLQAGPWLRREARWHAAQLAQFALVLLCSLAALVLSKGMAWVVAAWGLFGLFVVLPRLLTGAAARARRLGRWRRAWCCQWLAGGLAGGNLGRLYRDYAAVFEYLARGDLAEAGRRLDALVARPMPGPARGIAALWKLTALVEQRDWEAAADFFERAPEWGTLWNVTQARLLAASAYAETGRLERGLRSLVFVVLSPLAVRLAAPLWMTRVRLAAVAGDASELERLLARREFRRRGLPRFAAYWRGRCALTRGLQAEAVRDLTRAYALTPPRDNSWRQAITYYLKRAEAGAPAPAEPLPPEYESGLAALRLAEEQAAPWRALMQPVPAGPTTLWLLAVLTVVFALECILPAARADWLFKWAGNGPAAVRLGEWWRLFTAMFLHGGLLHLAMNGFGLWIFGSAIERALGRWRMLAIFLLGGAAGNLLSAMAHRYELAVGASGGLFALVGAFVVAVHRVRRPIYAGMRRRLLVLLALMVAADLTIGWLEPQVDNLAHLGGLIAGVLLAL